MKNQELFEELIIIALVKTQRHKWIGLISRMPLSRIPNIILSSTIGGKKRKGDTRQDGPERMWRTYGT